MTEDEAQALLLSSGADLDLTGRSRAELEQLRRAARYNAQRVGPVTVLIHGVVGAGRQPQVSAVPEPARRRTGPIEITKVGPA